MSHKSDTIFTIVCLTIFLFSIIGTLHPYENSLSTLPSPAAVEEKQEAPQSTVAVSKTEKRLSIDEQDIEGKGVYIPVSEGAGMVVDDIGLSQIYYHTKFNISAYNIDLDKYPQLASNVLKYSEYIAAELADGPEGPQDVDVYIYSTAPDLYYLRNFPQDIPKNLMLELERLRPILHIVYKPGVMLTTCVFTPDGYKLAGKYPANG